MLPSLIGITGTNLGHSVVPSFALLGPVVSGGRFAGRRTCSGNGAVVTELAVWSEVESVVTANEDSDACTAGAASMDEESVKLELSLILGDREYVLCLGGYTADNLPLG